MTKLPIASPRDDCPAGFTKLATPSSRDDCPESFEEIGTWSNRSYLYLLDNNGDYVRNSQGLPIIVGLPPEFPTKLEVTSCRDD